MWKKWNLLLKKDSDSDSDEDITPFNRPQGHTDINVKMIDRRTG